VIQNAKLHNHAGIIQLKRSHNDDEIVLRSEGQIQHFKVNKSDTIWVTVNIIYGTLKVQIGKYLLKVAGGQEFSCNQG
jgi:isopenicillin N synthase-like dioxygenase